MGRKNDPNWRVGNTFTEEELNPNRPHEYRRTHNGESPIGNIHKINAEKKAADPEAYAEKMRLAKEKEKKTKSMKKRAQEILAMTIKLSDEEKQIFLKGLELEGEITVQDAILYGQVSEAVKTRNTAAAAFVRDTSGQKPKDEVECSVSVDNILKNGGVFEDED